MVDGKSKDLEASRHTNAKDTTDHSVDFDEILNRTVDGAIRGIFGESADDIYYHMNTYGITNDRLGENPEDLEKAMTEIFKFGWGVFRKAILRSLCQQLNLSIEMFAGRSFAECVAITREEFSHNATASSNKMMNKVQNDELKATNESIMQLSLSHIETADTHKTCKVCDSTINSANTKGERLLADLCNHCWEFQNAVWEFLSPLANVPAWAEHGRGDFRF